MAAISFVIARKVLKIAQIVQINQLFQLLNLICAYSDSFYLCHIKSFHPAFLLIILRYS